ncbi:MAG: hypothetical protein IJX30_06205 [Clostridia bacterium]|nr:hypothetical protein [Clostridia bacterium]
MFDKHAYLVMAHDNFRILKKQIELLDDEKNDFYIHIDERVEKFDSNYLLENIKKSKVKFISNRKVFWADYTQTQTELDLIGEALNNGGGGTPICIYSQEQICL